MTYLSLLYSGSRAVVIQRGSDQARRCGLVQYQRLHVSVTHMRRSLMVCTHFHLSRLVTFMSCMFVYYSVQFYISIWTSTAFSPSSILIHSDTSSSTRPRVFNNDIRYIFLFLHALLEHRLAQHALFSTSRSFTLLYTLCCTKHTHLH